MTFPATEIDSERSEHTMLSLIMAIFIFYATTTLGLYFAKTLSPESFYSLTLTVILLLWTFKEEVIDFISPALLRLFGVGGQGYLHLLSLWFVDPRDLTLIGVATRVLAGSYSAVLAAIFFIPLVSSVFIYLMNLYDALTPQASVAEESAPIEQQNGREEGLTNQDRGPTVSVSTEAPLVFEPEVEEEGWLLTEFDMDAFLVLCPLGRGQTARVMLCQVDLSRRSQAQTTGITSQPGTFFDPNGGESSEDGMIVKQDGSFWAEPTNTITSVDTASTSIHQQSITEEEPEEITEAGSDAAGNEEKDFFDEIIGDIEEQSVSSKSQNVQNGDRKKESNVLASWRPFGPGGGPPTVTPRQAQIELEGGWRKLEPHISNQMTTASVPQATAQLKRSTSTDRSSTGGQISRPISRASSRASSNQINSSAAAVDRKLSGPQTIMSKIRMNSASRTKLNEIAGEVQGDGDAWWRPVQWIDEVQRQESGMDEVFAVAPGFEDVPITITELEKRERAATVASSRSSVNDIAGMGRRGSAASNLRPQDLPIDRRASTGFTDDDDGNAPASVTGTPMMGHSPFESSSATRFSNHPSVLSLDESEMMNADDGQDEGNDILSVSYLGGFARRREMGLEEMPDLVAIKMMRKGDIERMQLKKTVENERRALAMCSSPFVCNMFGAFQDSRWAYILLEPVPAGDLAGLIEQRQVMSESEALFYVGCLLLALDHLHTRGIVCLDVKPENLLLDQYGYCKLCDLGIARIFVPTSALVSDGRGRSTSNQQSQHWEFAGTPEYMSPEVICRHKIAPGTAGIAGPDLWACGVLLFELLYGEPPFSGDTTEEVVAKIQKYMMYERNAINSTMSRYQRWANRVLPSSASLSSMADWSDSGNNNHHGANNNAPANGPQAEDAIPMTPELEEVFEPIKRASPEARALIQGLLRADPQRRIGCRSEGARRVMEHAWFTQNMFDWRSLRRREMKAPFVPNPITLAPPFRGEKVEEDITRQKPLSLYEFRMCQNFLKGLPLAESDEKEDASSFKGFIQIPPTDKSRPIPDRKSPDFLQTVRHVQQLFRDDVD